MTVQQLTAKVEELEARRAHLEEEWETVDRYAREQRAEAAADWSRDKPLAISEQFAADEVRRMIEDADAELDRVRKELEAALAAERVKAERAELVRLAEACKAAEGDYLRAMEEGNRAMLEHIRAVGDARRRAVEARRAFLALAQRHAPILGSGFEAETAQREFLEGLGTDLSAVRSRLWNGPQSRPTGIDAPSSLELPEPFGRIIAEAVSWPAVHELSENV